MNSVNLPPKAFFFSPDGKIYPDTMICSGMISAELNGKPCPYAQNGQFPNPIPLDETKPLYSIDKGNHGDLCPPCAKQQLTNLGHWQGHNQQDFPKELLPLRLFKCRMGLWLVVLGLNDSEPTKINI